MEELIESMGDRIKLTEGERKGITIIEFYTADLRARSECCLLGRLISDRRIQKEAFKALMTRLWKTLEAVAFKELLDNLFDRSVLVLKEIDENIPPLQMDFSKALFWVQGHDMPLTCMNREVGFWIGQSMALWRT